MGSRHGSGHAELSGAVEGVYEPSVGRGRGLYFYMTRLHVRRVGRAGFGTSVAVVCLFVDRLHETAGEICPPKSPEVLPSSVSLTELEPLTIEHIHLAQKYVHDYKSVDPRDVLMSSF